MKKPADPKPVSDEPTADAPPADTAPARRSAMKLPPGVIPKTGASGPTDKGPAWGRGEHGRPQRDAARRAGKSRKVH